MEKDYVITGGARVGWFKASWPFATLTARPGILTIAALFAGTYEFTPDQVANLEISGGWRPGLRIHHNRADVPERLIFYSFGSSQKVLQKILEAGFLPAAAASIPLPPRGVPFRWTTLIAVMVLWNTLGLLSMGWHHSLEPGPLTMIPLGLVAVFSWGLLYIPSWRKVILRPGRHFEEIRAMVCFVAIFATAMAIFFAAFLAARSFFDLPSAF